MKRLVVLISGRGTNLQALLDATAAGDLDASIAVVISNRADAPGLRRAEQAGVTTMVVDPANHGSRDLFDAELGTRIAGFEPDLVVLAGWMLILGERLLDRFPGRVINLHPALPGCFPGTNAIERAYDAFRRGEIDHTGVMVHYVIPEVDAGSVIISETVLIDPDDTLDALTARIHEVEHRLIVQAVRLA